MSQSAEALRALAAVADTTGSVRAALAEWSSATSEPAVARVSARARMGAPLGTVLMPLRAMPDGCVVARAIEAHARHGGSLAMTTRALADAQETRFRSAHEVRLAGSATKLSGRLLGALGAAAMLLIPGGRPSSPSMAASLGVALVLATIGAFWIRRIAPRPPEEDPPAAATADLAAGLIDAGLHPAEALDLAFPAELRARRLVGLGLNWTSALSRTGDEDLEAMAQVLRGTTGSGSMTSALRRFARTLREEQRRECDVATRRAPVLLVLPLTLCFLPAFALVVVGPLTRGLSG